MNYNIHPLFVHFPIALLFVYSLIKNLPLKKWFPKVAWRDIERVLLVVGVLGAFAALATGDTAQHLTQPNRALVNAHSDFGAFSTFIYGSLLAGEFAAVINAFNASRGKAWGWLTSVLQFVEEVLCNPAFSAVLAFVGLVAISVTGLLGGTLAYGLTADPVAPFVLHLLGITL